jgi:SAM-dependent methyltransferase
MTRFTWAQVQDYWRRHDVVWSGIDFEQDSDGLTNVMLAGAPIWLNEHYARFQRAAYGKLFSYLPVPRAGARALDVGCGAARWARFLADQGYETTGIDLQPKLIELNRKRYPHIRFLLGPVQELHEERAFDLVSSVTVLQHIPFDQQDETITTMRRLLRPGGHALVLENVRDELAHVFPNSIGGWTRRFSQVGFVRVGLQRYDYSPLTRLLLTVPPLRSQAGGSQPPSPAELNTMEWKASMDRSARRRLYKLVRRAAMWMDRGVESVLFPPNIRLPTDHCGFLFKAV